MVVGGFAASLDKTFTTALAGEGNAPLSPLRGTSPRESVSHDSHSPAAPYESCSLATLEGEVLEALALRDMWHVDWHP